MNLLDISAEPLSIESLDHEGRGIARRDGKTIFVDGGLPGERVTASVYRRKRNYENAQLCSVVHESPSRVQPRCAHFGLCGGCALQHVDLATQVAVKQRVLEDALWHIGKVRADEMLAPVHGPAWEYRHRARFTVRYVPKKGGVLVGFHERRSSYVADMAGCEVVPERISRLLPRLREVIGELSIRQRLPQVELAAAENADVLVFRVLDRPSARDEEVLRVFAREHSVQVYLQPGGPDTAVPLHGENSAEPYYTLPEFGVRIYFAPTDFTQVNYVMNRVLVRRAMRLLEPQAGERIADLFCGLGNFSLPIARAGAYVLGLEGSAGLVQRARRNAERNGLAEASRFETVDLFKMDAERVAALAPLDGMLIDPPRDGAAEVVKAVDHAGPRRVVYVSCNPGTLARDAAILVHEKGYALRSAGVLNMFPHTAHVESIALFER